MRNRVLVTLFLAAALSLSATPQRARKRKIACMTPENAGSCYWTHGRLAAYNGTPTMRLWKIGTKRILAIHSGPSYKGSDKENEEPEMPANVYPALSKSAYARIVGDFEICSLEPEEAGVMQDVCIESAKNIVEGK